MFSLIVWFFEVRYRIFWGLNVSVSESVPQRHAIWHGVEDLLLYTVSNLIRKDGNTVFKSKQREKKLVFYLVFLFGIWYFWKLKFRKVIGILFGIFILFYLVFSNLSIFLYLPTPVFANTSILFDQILLFGQIKNTERKNDVHTLILFSL